ncbi:MAG: redox-sensitive transcriptional activator SoxR [Pseudomonadota bacterium]
MKSSDWLSIGQLAGRTGLSVSAIRFYEAKGLIAPGRNTGGQRRFRRSDIRRLSFVQITQQFGFSIAQIRELLHSLPEERTPNQRDWSRISRQIRSELDRRIETLERLRNNLDGCIGCGCLSLKRCALYNPQDSAAQTGPGPRYLLDRPPEPSPT